MLFAYYKKTICQKFVILPVVRFSSSKRIIIFLKISGCFCAKL